AKAATGRRYRFVPAGRGGGAGGDGRLSYFHRGPAQRTRPGADRYCLSCRGCELCGADELLHKARVGGVYDPPESAAGIAAVFAAGPSHRVGTSVAVAAAEMAHDRDGW